MKRSNTIATGIFCVLCICSHTAIADDERRSRATDEILDSVSAAMESVVSEVIGQATAKAEEVVRQNTGIDISKRGYQTGRQQKVLPSDASEETRRELIALQSEHDRTIMRLQEELDRKLAKAREEFEREAAKEDKSEKVYEKRAKLEEKVDAAYAQFDEKVAEENRRFDEKREKIIERQQAGVGEGRGEKERDDEYAREERRRERGELRSEREKDTPERARRNAEQSQASDIATEKSAAHGEEKQKRWWQFWKD